MPDRKMAAIDIAKNEAFRLITDIQQNMIDRDQVATGETSDSLSYKVEESNGAISISIFGARHIGALEEGRRPGGMPPIWKIQRWIQAKGLSLNAFAVAKKMAEEGSLLFREGGDSGTLSTVLTAERAEEIRDAIGLEVIKDFQAKIINQLRKNK